MHLFHRWKLVLEKVGTSQHGSLLFKRDWGEPIVARKYRCLKCGAIKATLTNISNQTHKIPVALFDSETPEGNQQ